MINKFFKGKLSILIFSIFVGVFASIVSITFDMYFKYGRIKMRNDIDKLKQQIEKLETQ